jgi:hypothetical protein
MSETKRIDVRGVNPTYINGNIAISLVGCKRDITVEEAEKWIAEQDKANAPQK